MSNRRLIRHGPGVLMAFLLLATLVPTSNAQTCRRLVAGTGAVQGIAVDANTREPLVEVINIIVIPGQAAVCGGATGLNPLTSTANLSTDVQQTVNNLTLGGTQLNCTSSAAT